MSKDFDNLLEFSKHLKSGELYESLNQKLTSYQNQKTKKKIKDISAIQNEIEKKENQIHKILGEIIQLQNQLSKLLDKELNA